MIKYYQNSKKSDHISTCIYSPSCSNYAILAFNKHNIFKAIILITKRIYRCDSTKNDGGFDFP